MNYVRNELVESSYTTTLYDSNIVSNPLSWESVLDWLKSKVSTLNIYIYTIYIYIFKMLILLDLIRLCYV